MAELKKVLVICGELSDSDRDQKEVLYRRLHEVGLRFHSVSFLEEGSTGEKKLSPHFDTVDFISPRSKTRMSWLDSIKKASGLFKAGTSEPSGLDILIPENIEQLMTGFYQKYHPRSVVCESVLLSACLKYFPKHFPTVLFGHECEQAEQLGMSEKDLREAYGRASFVLARTHAEKEKLSKLVANVIHVGSLVEESPQPVIRNSKIAILPHEGATSSAEFSTMLSQFLPALVEAHPEARFVSTQVGEGNPLADRFELKSFDNPVEYFKDCMLVINPYSGDDEVTDRILSAMACGRAVISTTAGARGVRGASGMGVFIADSGEQFGSSLSRIVGSDVLLKRASDSAFKFVHAYNRGTLAGLIKAMIQ